MPLSIPCPHCGERPVEAVRTARALEGELFAARPVERSWVGCDACTRALVLDEARRAAVRGWCALPWGALFTPGLVLGNLRVAQSPPDAEALARFLARQGIDIDGVVADASGRAPGDHALVHSVLAELHAMIWADGECDPVEVDVGVEVASRVLGDLLPRDEITRALAKRECAARSTPEALGPEDQLLLLKAACAVAVADGFVGPEELVGLRRLAERLGIDEARLGGFIDRVLDDATAEERDRERAAALLGLPAGACEAQARQALRRCLVACGELPCPADAARRREALQGAYKALVAGS